MSNYGKRMYCQATGKQMFLTRGDANKAVRRTIKSINLSVYQCPECHCFHLTHYTYGVDKDWGKRRNRHMLSDPGHGTYRKRNSLFRPMRQIPYRGKQGIEHGAWEFLQHSEIPDNIALLHSELRDAEIAAKFDMTCMNMDNEEGQQDIRSIIGEERYFAIWDSVDKRELFRHGEPTLEALASATDGFLAATLNLTKHKYQHRTKEGEDYEYMYQMKRLSDKKEAEAEKAIKNPYYAVNKEIGEKVREEVAAYIEREVSYRVKAENLTKKVSKDDDYTDEELSRMENIFKELFKEKDRQKLTPPMVNQVVEYIKKDRDN